MRESFEPKWQNRSEDDNLLGIGRVHHSREEMAMNADYGRVLMTGIASGLVAWSVLRTRQRKSQKAASAVAILFPYVDPQGDRVSSDWAAIRREIEKELSVLSEQEQMHALAFAVGFLEGVTGEPYWAMHSDEDVRCVFSIGEEEESRIVAMLARIQQNGIDQVGPSTWRLLRCMQDREINVPEGDLWQALRPTWREEGSNTARSAYLVATWDAI